MLNCSGGWKLIVTDIGRGRLAVNRRARYDTATHGSPRPRAPDLGGGSRPRPDEDGGHRAGRRRRGARAPPAARDRRDHRRGDGPRGGGAARRPRPRGAAAPGHRLYRRRVCRRVPRHRILAAGHGDRAARGPGAQPGTTRPFPPRRRQRALGPRASRGHRGRRHTNPARGPGAVTLAGRGAVVTGGSRGIGLAVARALAEAGAAVVVAARGPDGLEAAARALCAAGRRAWAVPCDVADPEGVRTLAREAETRLGHVDILVNNAGISHSASVQKTTLEDWQRILTANATGPFLCIQAFLPGMLARGWGRVVNIASVAGLGGGKYITAYSASKHAVVGLTRSVAAEVAGTGVTVNAVCPGYVDTEMTRQSVSRIGAKTGMSR